MRKSIAIDVRMIAGSGIGVYIRSVLSRIKDADLFDYYLFGNQEEIENYGFSEGKNLKIVGCSQPVYSISGPFCWRSRAARSADLFWSPHYVAPAGRLKALCVTVHDVAHLALPEYAGSLGKSLFARLMFGNVRRRASRIIAVSNFTAGELVDRVGVDPGKIRVTPLGVEERWFSLPSGEPPHERPYLLFVGNVKPHKNLRGLVEAFAGVRQKIPHDLVIVGKKEGFITADAAVQKVAGELGDRVRFTGALPQDRLEQYFRHASGLVLPSFYEGFGLPPLEAMACGCPVLVARAASLPEVCGDAALYCDPADSREIGGQIVRLLTDAHLRKALTARGAERARRFRWEATAEATLQVFEECLLAGERN